MKVQVVIPLALLTSIALVGLIKLRKKQNDKEERRNKFQDIKLRVTDDVLAEYQHAMAEKQNLLEKSKSDRKTLEDKLAKLQVNEERIKKEADLCKQSEKSDTDKLAVLTMDLNHFKAVSEKEITLWNTEIAGLKKQLAGRSSVCNFLKAGMSNARKICGDKEPNDANEKRAESPKEEQQKAAAPKEEQPKAEASKVEEQKAKASKVEQPEMENKKEEEVKATEEA